MSGISTFVKSAAIAAAMSFAATSAFAQGQSVTSEQAMAALKAVLQYAKKDGAEVSTAVVDREGKLVLLTRGNGNAPHNMGLARRKAITANTFKMKSIEWRDRGTQAERDMPDVIPLGGGVPIMVGGDVIGAVGVSGTRGGQEGDTAAAQAGADAAAALVKRLSAQASN